MLSSSLKKGVRQSNLTEVTNNCRKCWFKKINSEFITHLLIFECNYNYKSFWCWGEVKQSNQNRFLKTFGYRLLTILSSLGLLFTLGWFFKILIA